MNGRIGGPFRSGDAPGPDRPAQSVQPPRSLVGEGGAADLFAALRPQLPGDGAPGIRRHQQIRDPAMQFVFGGSSPHGRVLNVARVPLVRPLRQTAQRRQNGVHGNRSRRASEISAPHFVQNPYSPSSMRLSAARMRTISSCAERPKLFQHLVALAFGGEFLPVLRLVAFELVPDLVQALVKHRQAVFELLAALREVCHGMLLRVGSSGTAGRSRSPPRLRRTGAPRALTSINTGNGVREAAPRIGPFVRPAHAAL